MTSTEAVALADRVLVIEDGRIAHDIDVDYPASRPSRLGRTGGAGGSILRACCKVPTIPLTFKAATCEAAMNSVGPPYCDRA